LFFHGFVKLLDSFQHVCFCRHPNLVFVIHLFQYVLTNRIHFRSLVQIIQHFFKMVNNLNTNLNLICIITYVVNVGNDYSYYNIKLKYKL
jgi:hypothetical protein